MNTCDTTSFTTTNTSPTAEEYIITTGWRCDYDYIVILTERLIREDNINYMRLGWNNPIRIGKPIRVINRISKHKIRNQLPFKFKREYNDN